MYRRTQSASTSSLSTGFLWLDLLMGGEGFRPDCLVEIYGQPSTGKSTWLLQVIAHRQRYGATAVLVDAEGSFSPTYARHLAIDTERLIVLRPADIPQLVRMLHTLTREVPIDIIAIDSVSALRITDERPDDDDNGMKESDHRLLVNYLNGLMEQQGMLVVGVNQMRQLRGEADDREEWYWQPASSIFHEWADLHLQFCADDGLMARIRPTDRSIRCEVVDDESPAHPLTCYLLLQSADGFSREAALIALALRMNVVIERPDGFYFEGRILGASLAEAVELLTAADELNERLEYTTYIQARRNQPYLFTKR